MYVYMNVCMYVVYMYVCVYMCVCMYVCMYVCVYVCVYILSPASKLDTGNSSLLWQRASLHLQLGEQRRALEAFEQLLKVKQQSRAKEHTSSM